MPNVVPRLFATAALGSLLLMGCPSSDDNSSGSGGQSGRGGAGGGSGGQSGGSGGAGQTGGTGGGSGGQSGGAGGGSGGQSGGTGGGAGGQSGGSGGRADAGRGGSGGGSADARGSGGSGGGRGDAGGAAKMAVANIATFSNGTITGTVTFVEVAGGVQVTYALENCPAGRHPTHIHSGNGCGSVGAQGMHWDVPRGENIGPNGGEITCGADNKGTLVHMRPNSGANTRWTIGDGSDSDVVGHPVVVHGIMDANARHGCGVIAVK